MRLLIDSLIAVMLVAILGAILVHYREEQTRILRYQQVHLTLASLQEQALFRGALGEVETSPTHFPLEISVSWFDNRLPTNIMVPGRQPWLDIAPPEDSSDHPPDPVISRSDQAGFWYNPARGLFRARVMAQFTEEETLQLYNELNGTALRAFPHPVTPYPKPHPALVNAANPASPAPPKTILHSRTSLVDEPRP